MEPNGVTIETALGAAATSGDPRLVERLVSNLLDNAVRHNVAHGYVKVATSTGARSAILSVTNSGPVVPAGEIDRLFQPFQRLDGYRAGQADGLGLGLSIVQAIANGHAATVTTRAQTDGGFHIEVQFRGADSDKRNDSH
jgi:signal transduction histidine kinase